MPVANSGIAAGSERHLNTSWSTSIKERSNVDLSNYHVADSAEWRWWCV
jgi:hypothetical protein